MTSQPYTIDDNNLCEYYQQLKIEDIEEDVELMKSASLKELYELIATDCRHYVSIIEHYKTCNLQTMFNMIIRRIDKHLVIKFKLNPNDRWVEVGFLDDSNTDNETVLELERMINYHLKHSDDIHRTNRLHLASQLDDDIETSKPISLEVSQTKDNLFDVEENPELKITSKQSTNAGYSKVPDCLKAVERQLTIPTQQLLDLSQYDDKTDKTGLPPVISDEITQFKDNLKRQLSDNKVVSIETLSRFDSGKYTTMIKNISEHQQLRGFFEEMIGVMRGLPAHQHIHLYQFMAGFLRDQDPIVLASLFIELVSYRLNEDRLTTTQKEIIKKYDIDLSNL
jgi:HAMP domain-containing protein